MKRVDLAVAKKRARAHSAEDEEAISSAALFPTNPVRFREI